MASISRLTRLQTVVGLLLFLLLDSGSAQSCMSSTEQPVVNSIDPPSGTTGTAPGLSTRYTINGARLDQVSNITVEIQTRFSTEIIPLTNENRTADTISFNLETSPGLSRGGVAASVQIMPINTNCNTVMAGITLFEIAVVSLSVGLQAQPGTTIVTSFGSCLPDICGDNSTMYNLIIGGIPLEILSSTSTEFAARFPEFTDFTNPADFVISTQYQMFILPVSNRFTLLLQTNATNVIITPSQGQRGTRITISGMRLLGLGTGISLSQVTIGGVEAEIFNVMAQNMAQTINVEASSGTPGTVSISINTTQTVNNDEYDGPYTFLENVWTQLEDGLISDIIPPAIQMGGMVTLCGQRLLGGGTAISEVTLVGISSTIFSSSPFLRNPPLPGDECIAAEVPAPNGPQRSGLVQVIANTGAIVESTMNFTFAEIREISPSRGQFGTIVHIRGTALLSGYNPPMESVTVTLNGIGATVRYISNTEVVVRAASTNGTLYGQSGSVIISVAVMGNYSVSSTTQTWTYETPGQINSVMPSSGQLGTTLTVTGGNLLAYGDSLDRAAVGGLDAAILSQTNTVVTLMAPNGPPGMADIALISDNGAEVRGVNVFMFRPPGTIDRVEPDRGQSGTYVSIIGINLFGYGSNVTNVMFGEIPATIDYTQSNNTLINIRIQPNTALTQNTPVNISITSDTGALVQSSTPIWTYLVQGAVTDIQPPVGQIGTRVTITGTDLRGGGSNVQVFVDDVQGDLVTQSDTSIVVTMRSFESRNTSPFPGQALIIANTGAIVLGGSYSHRRSGTIDSFSPIAGREGTEVTITGQNLLGFGENIAMVTVAGIAAREIVGTATNSQVVIELGAGPGDATGPIQLTINTGASITSAMNFTFEAPGVINSVVPSNGAEGSGIRIAGSNLFPSTVQLTSVTIGGIPVSRIVTSTRSELSIIVGQAPALNSFMAEIEITASDGSSVSGAFFNFLQLSISLIGRTSGREGTEIEISVPTQFNTTTELRATIDDEDAVIVGSTLNTVTVRVPRAKRAGSYMADVVIETPDRLVARLLNGFTYLPQGAIYSVIPNNGQRGTIVVLEGEYLLGGGTVIQSARVANVSAMVMSSNDGRVELRLMENPDRTTVQFPFTGDIMLVADTGATTCRLNGFTIVEPGDVVSVTPMSGQFGTRVTITGTGLLQGGEDVQQIELAGVQAILRNVSNNMITVEASSSPGNQSGLIDITLATGAMITSTDSIQFEYLEPGMINSVSPNHGTTGTRVTLEGTNLLGGGDSVDQVLLAGVEANVTAFSNDRIVVIAQEDQSMINFGDIEIIINTGAMIIKQAFWTHNPLGNIMNINPPVGQRGIEVTLQGVRLLGSSGTSIEQCSLAGIAGEVVSASRTTVVCRAGLFRDLLPENGSGPAEIVTNLGVVIKSETNITFTYYFAQINTVSPQIGNNGTIVVISGVNLFGFPNQGSTISSIMFGGVPASVMSSFNSDITVRVGLSPNATQNDTVRVSSSAGSFLELENAWRYSPPAQIDSISPTTGFSGSRVLIIGTNLSPPLATEVVVIVGQTRSSQAQIINSTTIEFFPGVHQSTNNAGEQLPIQIVFNTGETVYEPQVTFMYNATPGIIESISPIAGAGDTEVTISGRNLIGALNISQVYLAGVPVARIMANSTDEEIVVIAGAGPNSGQFGPVVIETNDGRQFGMGGNAWRYYPVVNSEAVIPNSGQNGTVVIVSLPGEQLYPNVENVTFAGYPVADFSFDISRLTVTVDTPDSINTPLTGDIVIYFMDSTQLVIPNVWTYLNSVQLSMVSPSNMQGYFNSLITLSGQNFQAGGLVNVTEVYLAGVGTTVQSQSNTELQIRITEERNSRSQSFFGPIVIISDQSATYTSLINFTYVQVQVYSIDPQQGQRGTRVNITGIGLLLGGASVSNIMFGDVMATVLNATDSEMIVSAGDFPNQTNISDIMYRVDTEAQLTIPDSWRYILPGEVTSVTPNGGGMGTIVTIMGTNLFGGGQSAEEVLLNNVPAQSIVTNFDSFIQVVAGQSTSDLTPGNVQIISDTGAITESSMNITYDYLTPGVISTTQPSEGQNGTMVTIVGSFLHNGERVSRILLAGVEATIETIIEDASQRGFPSRFTVRAGRPSVPHSFSGPVTIISHFNTMSVSSFNFSYLSEGVIFSVTPDRGQRGTEITIVGENLLGGGTNITSAFLAGVRAEPIATPTNTSIQLEADSPPTQDAKLGDVVLISDTGAYVRRVDGWLYVEQGEVSDIQPRQGQFGTMITITGQNLLSGGDRVTSGSLDDTELDITSSSPLRVQARVGQPDSFTPFETFNITLVSNTGGFFVDSFQWNFLNQSMIIEVSPGNGFGGAMVNISGTDLLGGGTRIASAYLDDIEANVMFSNDILVVLMAGYNVNGQQRTGDIRLESDTGATTTLTNGWTYDDECGQGMFGNITNCQPCDSECLTCDGPNSTDCFTCLNFAIELDNSTDNVQCVPACVNVSTFGELRFCRDACESNEYQRVGTYREANMSIDGTYCFPCHPQCDPNLGCSGPNSIQCGGCSNVFNLNNQTCIPECPVGTFEDELRNCVPCDRECTSSGCIGPNATDCNQCSNTFVSVMTIDGVNRDFCLADCPRLYVRQSENNLCAPCNDQCLNGCTDLSPFNCVGCKNASFIYPNGTRLCVSTCNPNPNIQTYYEDSERVCQRCSDVCLTGGCSGPSPMDCFSSNSALVAGGGAIAIFIIILIIVVGVVVVLVIYIIYRSKHGYKYQVDRDDESIELGFRETKFNPIATDGESATNEAKVVPVETVEVNQKESATLAKMDNMGGSQDLYTEMSPDVQSEPRYTVPTPKSQRKAEAEPKQPPPQPVPYEKFTRSSKPPPPRPPSPTPDQDLYTDMEAGVQEVHMNQGAVAEEEYSEMAPGPIMHHPEEVYDEASSVQPNTESTASVGKPPAPTPSKEDQVPLIEDMYEDADTAIAQANEYKRTSLVKDDPIRDSKRFSAGFDKPPDLPSRLVPKKRISAPLPETPLEKSLSKTSVTSMASPPHQPLLTPVADDDIYIEPQQPIEESLYEELPTGVQEPPSRGQVEQSPAPVPEVHNEIPLPPKNTK